MSILWPYAHWTSEVIFIRFSVYLLLASWILWAGHAILDGLREKAKDKERRSIQKWRMALVSQRIDRELRSKGRWNP